MLMVVTLLLPGTLSLAAEEKSGRERQAEGGASQQHPDTGRTAEPKPRPVKPFVPSEKISADSAVAFPVDI